MKLSLVVLTAGKMKGKSIPVPLSQFVIGRDPQCHLRPASPLVSNRHCAVLVRGSRVYVRDFESTNGTFVNEKKVDGEVEVQDQDRLRVGPVSFTVRVEVRTPVDKPTPPPPTRRKNPVVDDDTAAALLLSLQDGDAPAGAEQPPEEVPGGSTVMEMIVPPEAGKDQAKIVEAGPKEKKPAAQPASGDTSTAAEEILKKYLRRPRQPAG